MITDKQRREVARKLRKLASENQGAIGSMCKMQEVLTQAKKITGTMNLPSVAHVLERYADLIDRPTCKPKDRGIGYVDAVCDSFWCPSCSFEIDVHIGEDQHLTEAAKYCPNCGAEVVE